jgi:hypothetical protein
MNSSLKRRYAILDPQSDTCFVSPSIVRQTGAKGVSVQLKLTTMLDEEIVSAKKVHGLYIQDMTHTLDTALPAMCERNKPANHNQIPRPETVRDFAHLSDIADCLHPYQRDLQIGVPIGLNCPRLIKPRDSSNREMSYLAGMMTHMQYAQT